MSLQILIADDDPDDLEMLEEALNEALPGLVVHKAAGGKAAVKLLGAYEDNRLPHLIILDFNMPDLNGSEVLAYIQGQRRYDNVPRVIFSTSGSQRHVLEAMGKGATGYFVKASTKKDLDEVTAKMLALAKPE
ncbi:MAG: response regulator [Chitinophagaceae bacterium]|nr:response regulator [Chitinophagaceae bacterium]